MTSDNTYADEVASITDLAELLGVSTRTVRRYVADGLFFHARVGVQRPGSGDRRRIVFTKEDVRRNVDAFFQVVPADERTA